MNKKNMLSVLVGSTILFGAMAPYNVMATNFLERDGRKVVISEISSGNTKETAQEVEVTPTKTDKTTVVTYVPNALGTHETEHWYKVNMEEKGSLGVNILDENGNTFSPKPKIDIYTTLYDGSFGKISSDEGFDEGWTTHKKDVDVYVKVTSWEFSSKTLEDHIVEFTYGINPDETDPHAPNSIFDRSRGYYETAPIEEGEWVTSKWNTDFDGKDLFSINPGKTKGDVTFDVKYPDDEFQFWRGKDYYKTYYLHAEVEGGGYKTIDSIITTGMPNQTESLTVSVDDDSFTGKYALELINGYQVNPEYDVKLSFDGEEAPVEEEPKEETPEVPVEEEPKEETPEVPVEEEPKEETPEVPVEEEPKEETPEEPAEEEAPLEKAIERLSGETRYETSLALSKHIPNKSLDKVIIADGQNYPDALAGGVLNNKMNATVLLVRDQESRITPAIQEAQRLLKSNGEIVILGGEAAVSKSIEQSFAKKFKTSRIGGQTRVDTSINIANKVNSSPSEVIIASGKEFADALSIVPYATKTNKPILLNTSTSTLDTKLLDYAKSKKVKKVTIVGGEAAVPKKAAEELKKAGITVERISGATRYETSLAIANKHYSDATTAALANGQNFPDSLSGSRLAYEKDMPILLSKKDSSIEEVEAYLGKKQNLYIYGGEQAISKQVYNKMKP